MRTSQPTSGFRPLRAGVAVAATTAAVLAGLTAPAFAANTPVLLNPNTGPVGGGTTVTLTGTGAFPAASASVLAARTVTGTANCAATYGTTGTTAVATRSDDDDATVVLPVLAAGTFKICVYGVASGSVASTTALTATSDVLTISVANTKPVLSAASGPVAGGNTITATGGGTYLSAVTATALGATFTTATCPATYSTATGNFAATATKTTTSVATITVPADTLTAGTAYNVCLYSGVLASSALVGSGSTQYTALPPATISPKAGSSGSGSTITVTAPTMTTFAASPSPLAGVTFTTGQCPSTYTTAATRYVGPFAGTVIRINGGKIAVTLPSSSIETAVGASTTTWNVCTYANATTGALILAPATYTVAPALTIGLLAVSPSGGPAQGGTTVTVTGTGFPYPMGAGDVLSASIGGIPLTDVTSTSSTTLTGKTGPHGAGAVGASVTTAAGTVYSTDMPFTYSYGISVTPNSASPSATVTLDVQGAGFSSLTFGDFDATTPDDTKAHVLLVDNSWFAGNSNDPNEAYADGGVFGECAGVIKIGDNELICNLDLTVDIDIAGEIVPATPAPAGTYQIVVVNAGTTLTSTTHSNISSASTFTVATY
jgi:hypothetical protein